MFFSYLETSTKQYYLQSRLSKHVISMSELNFSKSKKNPAEAGSINWTIKLINTLYYENYIQFVMKKIIFFFI
ncbi:hypothetical protein DIS18_11990 [Algibacter marinivivus]|uniref:Uncharacterized protein n=1 Tax=Algibacter marinivivus TaxID=2100723 RepID=A0A2U2X2H4_9FLAO|nr:hypothetical protein DIS18_11990 [Algibacter marinivivus]